VSLVLRIHVVRTLSLRLFSAGSGARIADAAFAVARYLLFARFRKRDTLSGITGLSSGFPSLGTHFCDIPPTLLQFYLFRFAVPYYRIRATFAERNFVSPMSLRIPSEKVLSFRSARRVRERLRAPCFKQYTPTVKSRYWTIYLNIPEYAAQLRQLPCHLAVISVNAARKLPSSRPFPFLPPSLSHPFPGLSISFSRSIGCRGTRYFYEAMRRYRLCFLTAASFAAAFHRARESSRRFIQMNPELSSRSARIGLSDHRIADRRV